MTFTLGPDATDCHVHVFERTQTYVADRDYDPPAAGLDELSPVHAALGVRRLVVVQPSVCGTDNRSVLLALARMGTCARGVVVLAGDVSDSELDVLSLAGVRGVRVNRWNRTTATPDDDETLRLATRVRRLGWHVEVVSPLSASQTLLHGLIAADVRIVLPHFALGPEPADTLLDLVASGMVWVKLSGAYHLPSEEWARCVAQHLLEAAPDRVVWGSDWPHVNASQRPTTDALAAQLHAWIPDAARRRRVLVDNPALLYGFEMEARCEPTP